MTVHEVKCWPTYFRPIVSGEKPFDVRKGDDRKYEVGDILDLREWDPGPASYTGPRCRKRVSYVMHGAPFLPEDTWVLGLARTDV